MTKEEEKAIKVLERYKQECIEEYKVELDDKKNIDEQHASYLRQQIESVYTVLNMLKEKDNKINELSKKLYLCTPEIPQCQHGKYVSYTDLIDKIIEKDKEIEKKDKIIDLMAKYINYLSDELVQATGKNELKFCDGNKCCKDSNYSCEECIKQYFERKVEE